MACESFSLYYFMIEGCISICDFELNYLFVPLKSFGIGPACHFFYQFPDRSPCYVNSLCVTYLVSLACFFFFYSII